MSSPSAGAGCVAAPRPVRRLPRRACCRPLWRQGSRLARLGTELAEASSTKPGIDGWEATRCIKAHAALCDIPIIALAAHAMTGDAERALQSGCHDYLSKSLDEDLLFAKLAKFLGQA
jgi:CheY-like chemotaxis protein